MERIRRNERMTAMMKLLSGKPNRIFTLNSFCEMFGSAKSILGIFSLDLSRPITLEIYSDECEALLEDIKPFLAEE